MSGKQEVCQKRENARWAESERGFQELRKDYVRWEVVSVEGLQDWQPKKAYFELASEHL